MILFAKEPIQAGAAAPLHGLILIDVVGMHCIGFRFGACEQRH